MNLPIKAIDNSIVYTKDQEKAISGLIDFIDKPYSNITPYSVLCGAAGTGKTFSIKTIIDQCKLSKGQIAVSAPTHKAKRVIGNSIGMASSAKTIQSLLGLRPDYDVSTFNLNSIQFARKGRSTIQDYGLIIIDEASMINKHIKKLILDTAATSQTKILFTGDQCQLPPVKEKVSSCLTGNIKYTLKTIVRQAEDNPISKLLQMFRSSIEGKNTRALSWLYSNKVNLSSNKELGYMCMEDEHFYRTIGRAFTTDEFKKDIDLVRVTAFTNNTITILNNYIRDLVVPHEGSILCKDDLLMSLVTTVDDFNTNILTNSEEYIVYSIDPYQDKYKGKLFKGFFVRLQEVSTGTYLKPIFVIDHTDEETLTNYFSTLEILMAEASKNTPLWKHYFDFRHEFMSLVQMINKHDKVIADRSLDYGFGLTVHRTQGSTYKDIFIDLHDIVYDSSNRIRLDIDSINRLIYVALSRCQSRAFIKL